MHHFPPKPLTMSRSSRSSTRLTRPLALSNCMWTSLAASLAVSESADALGTYCRFMYLYWSASHQQFFSNSKTIADECCSRTGEHMILADLFRIPGFNAFRSRLALGHRSINLETIYLPRLEKTWHLRSNLLRHIFFILLDATFLELLRKNLSRSFAHSEVAYRLHTFSSRCRNRSATHICNYLGRQQWEQEEAFCV